MEEEWQTFPIRRSAVAKKIVNLNAVPEVGSCFLVPGSSYWSLIPVIALRMSYSVEDRQYFNATYQRQWIPVTGS